MMQHGVDILVIIIGDLQEDDVIRCNKGGDGREM